MKRWLLIAMVAIAATAYADVTPIGDGWYLMVTEATLLDPGRVSIFLEDESGDASVIVMPMKDGTRVVAVIFGEFLASAGKHDKLVIYATDILGKAKPLPNGRRTSTQTVAWYGSDAEGLLADIAEATLLMFRTRDYRDRNVDAAFETTPEATARALEALDTARGE